MTDTSHIGMVASSGFLWSQMGMEAMAVLFDLRWMLAACGLLIAVDFHWGWQESRMHYKDALAAGDKALADKYKFHFSRAGRRSLGKAVEYITYLLIGAILGLAIFEPLGVCSHIFSAAVGLLFGCLFDLSSIVGHVCVLHGIPKPKLSAGSLALFAARVGAAFVRRKDADLGESIGEALDRTEKGKNAKGQEL